MPTPTPVPLQRPLPVWWRAICWLVALALVAGGLMVVPDQVPLGVALLVNGVSLGVALRLDSLFGTYLFFLGFAGATLVSGAILDESMWLDRRFYLHTGWLVAGIYCAMPLRVCFYAARNHRRLGKRLAEIVVIVLDLKRLLLFVALAPLAIWWWSNPIVRTSTWIALDQGPLAEHASQYFRRGPDQKQLLLSVIGPRLPEVEAIIEEGRTWPWFACGKGILQRVELTDEELERDAALTVSPWMLRSPAEAAGRLALMSLLEELGDGLVIPDERLTGYLGTMNGYPWYEGPLYLGDGETTVFPSANVIAAEQFGGLAARAAQQPDGPVFSLPEVILGFRLGHVPYVDLDLGRLRTAMCVLCGEITGPAAGVTEREDGSLVWIDARGAEIVVPPVDWMDEGWESPAPRPTMEAPSK